MQERWQEYAASAGVTCDETVRYGVTQTSYRVYQALLDQAQALYPPELQMRTYDVQITLGMAYLALPAFEERVDGLLRLRYGAAGQDRPEAGSGCGPRGATAGQAAVGRTGDAA